MYVCVSTFRGSDGRRRPIVCAVRCEFGCARAHVPDCAATATRHHTGHGLVGGEVCQAILNNVLFQLSCSIYNSEGLTATEFRAATMPSTIPGIRATTNAPKYAPAPTRRSDIRRRFAAGRMNVVDNMHLPLMAGAYYVVVITPERMD